MHERVTRFRSGRSDLLGVAVSHFNSWYEAPYMCNAGIAGFGKCAFWHAEMHVGWEGAMNPVQVWLTSNRPNPTAVTRAGLASPQL